MLIILKSYYQIKKVLRYFYLLSLIFSIALSQPNICEPKYWEYSEKSGTICRIETKRPSLYWIITKKIVKELCIWLVVAGIIAGILDLLGIWSPHIRWVMIMLGLKKCLLGLAMMSYKYPILCEILLKIAKCIEMTVLMGTILLVTHQPLEASSAIAMNSPVISEVVEAPAACELLMNAGIKVFLEKKEIIRKRYKISIEEQWILYEKLYENPKIASSKLMENHSNIKITIGQLNRIRKEWELSRGKGCLGIEEKSDKTKTIVERAGANIFSVWLKENNKDEQILNTIYELIKVYKKENPKENFRLLNARKTSIEKRWRALMVLPLLNIDKPSQLDYKEHDMVSVLGYSYSYSTLTQFLGELERVNAGAFLKLILSKSAQGEYCYIDGHLIAFWTRLKMHKGHITSNGRIMAGTNAVIAHDENGNIINFELYSPDTHMTHILEEYCSKIVALTGIKQFIIDREINSAKTACLFVEKGWELLCLLDKNEYKGLKSFKKKFCRKFPGGITLYKGTWNAHKEKDPRRFVIVQEKDRCMVYWGTPKIVKQLTGKKFITIYRNRTEIQENSFKGMIAHGALNINSGTKKIWGQDRTHQRKLDKINYKVDSLKTKEKKQDEKIQALLLKTKESCNKKQIILSQKRLEKLEQCHNDKRSIKAEIDKLEQQKKEMGPTGERADRDFRKQYIMTFRTLFLENILREFIHSLVKSMKNPVDTETILSLFFFHRAICLETPHEILYQFDCRSLSQKYQRILKDIIDGFNAISLTHNGKTLFAQINNII